LKIQSQKWLIKTFFYLRFCTRVSNAFLTYCNVLEWASNTLNVGEKITLEICWTWAGDCSNHKFWYCGNHWSKKIRKFLLEIKVFKKHLPFPFLIPRMNYCIFVLHKEIFFHSRSLQKTLVLLLVLQCMLISSWARTYSVQFISICYLMNFPKLFLHRILSFLKCIHWTYFLCFSKINFPIKQYPRKNHEYSRKCYRKWTLFLAMTHGFGKHWSQRAFSACFGLMSKLFRI